MIRHPPYPPLFPYPPLSRPPPDPFLPARPRHPLVPRVPQAPLGPPPQLVVVLQEEDRLRPAGRLMRRRVSPGRRRGHLGRGEIHPDAGALAGLAVHLDRAAMLLHQPVHRGEAEPRALAEWLRREERLEDAPPRLLVHPDARVLHGEAHEVARVRRAAARALVVRRSEEHTSELQS